MYSDYYEGEEFRQSLPTLVINPSITQYAIDNILWILSAVVTLTGYIMTDGRPKAVFIFLFLATVLVLFVAYVRFARIKYIITAEQIIVLHGILTQQTDYMELYRVVDYCQHRSMLQQMAGLKTVFIYSGDHSLPVLAVIGVPYDDDIVSLIRYRVELNKKRRGVYEITNRM
jgi:membrane protein YdbS with pleckstrin-like domain